MDNKSNIELLFSDSRIPTAAVTTRNGELFGPQLKFFPDGTLESVSILSNGLIVGTAQYWLESGNKFYELYGCPSIPFGVLNRQYIIDYLDVTVCVESSDQPVERWQASSDLSYGLPRHKQAADFFDSTSESEWDQIDPDYCGVHVALWPNGNLAYIGSFDFGAKKTGTTVVFWRSGLVRTVSFWSDDCAIGTRSCFAESGELAAEQNFHQLGSEQGIWVDRFFDWSNQQPFLSRVVVHKDFQVLKSWDAPEITSVLDEASFNRYVDPLYDSLVEMIRVDHTNKWKSGTRVDWSRHF